MNILVTGIAGFIASKVCEFLLAEGHRVVGIDNLNDAYDVRLKEWRLSQLKGKNNSLDSMNSTNPTNSMDPKDPTNSTNPKNPINPINPSMP